MADFTPQERKKIALDNNKLTLQCLDKNNDGRYASWVWGFRKNDATVTIWTNDDADKASKFKGRIEASIPLPMMFYLIEQIHLACEAAGEYKHTINLKDFIYPNGKRSEEPMMISQIFVGKNADGVVWLSVTAKDRPRYRFGFVPRTGFAELVDGDGNPSAPGVISKIYAKGYAKLLTNIYAVVAYHEYMPPKPKDGGGNNNRGGGSYGGGGGGGYGGGGGNAVSNDMDNDVPY